MTKNPKYDFLEPPTHPGDLGMLGSYRILGELGRGGMGYVFRAEDTVLERPVALKVMNKRIASTPNSRDRFLQEARAMAAVHHDNVVVIFEVGMHEGTPFMAMEMLRGQTLEAINSRKEAPDYQRVIQYARQIAKGLAAAHAKGIVHRDIKPANIWVEEGSERIKILDFGLALATSPDVDAAGVGSVCGTPGYLTPEQARSDPLDDRSDLYSLGVVLYEMCTGQLPTNQTAIAEQLVALLTRDPVPLRQLNPSVPEPLADLIHQLLAKEPLDRPANALILDKLLVKVAHDCEAKSETAVSLSKLQESLKLVVNKKDEFLPQPQPVMASAAGLPLGALPPVAIPTPSAPLPSQPLSASSSGTRIGGAAKTLPRPTRGTPKSEPAPVSPIVWAGGGVLVTLLLVLGIVWWIMPRQSENTLVMPIAMQPNEPPATPPPSPTSPSAVPTPTDQATQQQRDAEQEPQTAPRQAEAKREAEVARQAEAEREAEKERREREQRDAARNAAAQRATRSTTPAPAPASDLAGDPPMSTEQPTDSTNDEPAELSTTEVESEAASDSDPLARPTKPLRITTLVGIGADSTVRAESDSPLGTKPMLFVQRKKETDLQHIHLRFAMPTSDRSAIDQAALVLHYLPSQSIETAQLQLYGYAAPEAELWEEDEEKGKPILWRNSISRTGLDSLKLLATAESRGDDKGIDQATFQSDPLTEFVKNTKGDSVSFVISGGTDTGIALRFFSKERGEDVAPSLWLKVATDP